MKLEDMKYKLLAVLSAGLITAFAFPPYNVSLAVLPGLILFYNLNRSLHSFSSGFLFGIGLLSPITYWLFEFNPAAPFAVILLSALPYGLAAKLSRSPLTFASAMTAAEFFRSIGALAFPWGQLGTTVLYNPIQNLLQFIGVFGITFLLCLISSLIVEKIRMAVLIAAAAIVVSLLLSKQIEGEKVIVGIVQGNFPTDDDYEQRPFEVLNDLIHLTSEARQKGAKIIFWSETVILEYLNRGGIIKTIISNYVKENNITIVTGAPSLIDNEKRNSVFVFTSRDSETSITRYDKVHLVPFGEYIPGFGADVNHVMLPQGVGDFSSAVIPLPASKMGVMICFEGAFSWIPAFQKELGANMLVNLSNDAWSKNLAEAMQHSELTKPRALEFNTALIRAGNVGPSFIIDADGRKIAEIDAGRRGVITGEITLNGKSIRFMPQILFGWIIFLFLPFYLTFPSLFDEVNKQND